MRPTRHEFRLQGRTAEHFRRDGKAKVAFDDKESAKAEADRHGMNVYKCRLCKKWHMGHPSKRSPSR